MPERDTIFRTAEVLRRSLLGGVIRAARAQPRPGLIRVPRLDRLVGTTVTSVEARGKHLVIGLSNGQWLRTHMRMRGSWHRYRPGEPWRLAASRASCMLETDTAVAVCFDAPEAELLSDAQLGRHAALTALGPDLLSPAFDAAEAVRRLRARCDVPLGEALLDQRALAGIGNVYKSEICFMERTDPWMPVSALGDAQLASLVATARRLLIGNAGGGRRVTTGVARPGASLCVYGRGRPPVPALRNAHPGAPPGRARAVDVLVPKLPKRHVSAR